VKEGRDVDEEKSMLCCAMESKRKEDKQTKKTLPLRQAQGNACVEFEGNCDAMRLGSLDSSDVASLPDFLGPRPSHADFHSHPARCRTFDLRESYWFRYHEQK
jgi:hypothetical protein